MRVKVSAPVEVVEALEAALQSTPGAILEAPLKRRENAELRFGLKEVADIIVVVKDFAELVSLCWSGMLILRGVLAKPGKAVPAADTALDSAQGPIALEITTATARAQIAIPLESTREQVEKQLVPLQPRSTS